jgi:anti-anti-sigma regulatory factor
MKDSVEISEHYIVVKASSHKLDKSEAKHLLHLVQTEQAKQAISYVITDLSEVHSYENDCFETLENILEICSENNGILVCFGGQEEWMDHFAEQGLVLVPTKHEAIEYVFMDQLEKQFLSDEE